MPDPATRGNVGGRLVRIAVVFVRCMHVGVSFHLAKYLYVSRVPNIFATTVLRLLIKHNIFAIDYFFPLLIYVQKRPGAGVCATRRTTRARVTIRYFNFVVRVTP